jgi:hypothetical protein
MKKCLFLFFFWILSSEVFSQDSVSSIVSECIGFLGREGVPTDFTRANRLEYERLTSDGDYYVIVVEEGKVVGSEFLVYGLSSDEARQWVLSFFSFFENNNWQFVTERSSSDVYQKGSVYARIARRRSPSNDYYAYVAFSNDIDILFR